MAKQYSVPIDGPGIPVNMWEVEIKIPKHKWEVMYHTFENIEDLWKEIYWIMGQDGRLEEKIPLDLIEEIRVYKLIK